MASVCKSVSSEINLVINQIYLQRFCIISNNISQCWSVANRREIYHEGKHRDIGAMFQDCITYFHPKCTICHFTKEVALKYHFYNLGRTFQPRPLRDSWWSEETRVHFEFGEPYRFPDEGSDWSIHRWNRSELRSHSAQGWIRLLWCQRNRTTQHQKRCEFAISNVLVYQSRTTTNWKANFEIMLKTFSETYRLFQSILN